MAAGSRPSLACVDPCGGLCVAAAAEGADSSASESACLRRGGHPAERAGSGVWVGTLAPIDLSSPRWAPPLQQSAASALPEGSHSASSRGKIPQGFLSNINMKMNINILSCIKHLKRIFPLARPARGALGEGRRWGGPQSGGPSWWSWQMTLSPLQMLPSRPPHEEQGQ